MDDQIRYDYKAMQQAYEEMHKVKRSIEEVVRSFDENGRIMVQAMGGRFVEGYDQKRAWLQREVEDLNVKMADTNRSLQEQFDTMQRTDQQLGAGV